MCLLLGAIPIIRCSRGTAAEMVAVVRNYFLKYCCFETFLTHCLPFSILGRDIVSLFPFAGKTGRQTHQFSVLISVAWNSPVGIVILMESADEKLNCE